MLIADDKTRLNAELMASFLYGLAIGPFTYNLITLVLFLIIYEIIIALWNPPYRVTDRCKLLYSYLAGFIISRTIYSKYYDCDILPEWIP
jgi:hypothetical protein